MSGIVQSERGDGFSADWLALREPADHAARNGAVLAACLTFLTARRDPLRILDLGCGTGATLRAIAPQIARARPTARQRWTMVDHDPALLERARATCAGAHAMKEERAGGIAMEFRQADIADPGAVEALAEETRCDLIAGSALIDLVSAEWLGAVLEIAGMRRAGLMFALNYTGRETWTPPHPLDAAVLAAFRADQRRDKGFGPALGDGATAWLSEQCVELGFRVHVGESDWRLEAGDPLMPALAEGVARAVGDRGDFSESELAGWLAARRGAERVTVGHADIFGQPFPD